MFRRWRRRGDLDGGGISLGVKMGKAWGVAGLVVLVSKAGSRMQRFWFQLKEAESEVLYKSGCFTFREGSGSHPWLQHSAHRCM
jgi:hypothetical protein